MTFVDVISRRRDVTSLHVSGYSLSNRLIIIIIIIIIIIHGHVIRHILINVVVFPAQQK